MMTGVETGVTVMARKQETWDGREEEWVLS